MDERKPDQIIKIEGVGIVKVFGKPSVEAIVKRLLKCKSITG